MPDSATAPASKELAHWVRNALAHLYDVAYLQTHPLGEWIDAPAKVDTVTRAQRLRKALLSCIDELRPQEGNRPTAVAARAYVILTYRYIDDIAMEEIAGKLGLSRRQIYREHERAIDAVAALLAERHPRMAQVRAPVESPELVPARAIDLANAEVGRLKEMAHIEALSLGAVLNNTLEMLAPLQAQAGIHIEIVRHATSDFVFADRLFLRQALINLITLALDIGQTSIRCELNHAPNASHVTFSLQVQDVAGLPDLANADESVGVGLAVSNALVEAQKGAMSIEASAERGEWSAIIELPAANRFETVLVIDDNADLVDLFRRYLAAYAVNVVPVIDSQHVLRTCVEVQPSLITLDVMMPSMDGWDVLQQLKRAPQTRGIPIIVCSVLNEAKLALSMGASGYLTKPVNPSDFLAMLRPWLKALQPPA